MVDFNLQQLIKGHEEAPATVDEEGSHKKLEAQEASPGMIETSEETAGKFACHSMKLQEKGDQVKSDSQVNWDESLIETTVAKHDNGEV